MNAHLAIRARRAVAAARVIHDAVILVEGERIAAIGEAASTPVPPATPQLTVPIAMPGFIDMHTHGAFGHSFDESAAAATEVARRLAPTGVTTCYAGLGAAPTFEKLCDKVAALSAARPDSGGARLAGLFLEAPYINPAKHGAWPVSHLRRPDLDELQMLIAAASGTLRRINVAPELPGALPLIHAARDAGLAVSLGHSDAAYDEACAGVEAGATIINHTYNAMSPLAHRAPGMVGFALADWRPVAELILDGVHVHPAAALALFRARGPQGIALVTDNVPVAGLPDGVYPAGRRELHVRDGACRLADGTLAGSTIPFDQSLRNAAQFFALEDDLPALALLSAANAARAMGIDDETGTLAPGYFADLALLDDALHPVATVVRGNLAFQAGELRA